MTASTHSRYLAYFDPALILHYTEQRDKYRVEEDCTTRRIYRALAALLERIRGRGS